MKTKRWPSRIHAHPLLPYKGQKFYRVPVRIRQSTLYSEGEAWTHVIAPDAASAANLVRDEIAAHVDRPTEIVAYGPGGGETRRWIGWESMVGAELFRARSKYVQEILKFV